MLRQQKSFNYDEDMLRYYMFRDKWLTSPHEVIRAAGREAMAQIRVKYPGVTDWDI